MVACWAGPAVTLLEYIDWFREHQDASRAVPSRLHNDDTDGALGGLQYSPQFSAYLSARPTDEVTIREVVSCSHLHDATWPQCGQDRVYYRAPMWRAMRMLSGRRPQVRPSHPKPYALVVFLMESGYDWQRTSDRLGLNHELGEALLLMALRSLHGLYAQGPVPQRSWVDLSDSQRNALSAHEAVA